MTNRSIQAAETRAAPAALYRPRINADRYLLIDDSDEDITQILTVICDGASRRMEVAS